jgi:hypothetical protein
MDAFVQVALIEKSRRVFSTDADVFLSFPLLCPLTYTAEALAGLSTPNSAMDYAAVADFARTVNFLPRDIVASPSGDAYLWDVYSRVLRRAEVASLPGGSVEDQSRASILYDAAADGSRTESEAYRLYRQYRDAWFVAREDYNAHKLTGELSDDPAICAHWTDVDEPALRAAIGEAEAAWNTLGHRSEVEAALRAERDGAGRDPHRRWSEWVDAFNPDIDLSSETSGGPFAPTALSPRDFTAAGGWLGFELSAAEMVSLVANAPPELKVVLDGDNGGPIERVSFEYRSVAIVRPWFHGEALTSRIWRSDDPDLILSDGGDPPSGACPAYATAIVFVRNLTIVSRVAPNSPSIGNLHFTLPPDRLTRRAVQIDPNLLRRDESPVVRAPPSATLDPTMLRAFRRLDRETFTLASPRVNPVAPTTPAMIAIGNPTLLLHRRRWPATHSGPPSTPTPSPPSAEHHTEISILAFICKRLPRTPDPIATLRWD